MIRAVLAVCCALALLSLSLPVVEDARIERTEASLEGDLSSLDRTAAALADAERPISDAPGAQRTVVVRIPERSMTAAGVESVTIGRTEPNGYAYRIDGGPKKPKPSAVPVRGPDGDPVVLSESGAHRLVLTPARIDGERGVVVSRADRS